MKKLLHTVTFVVLCIALQGASAMTISSDAPGNLVVAGKPLQLTAKETQGEVRYELVDYSGRRVTEGQAQADGGLATVPLPGLKSGYYELRCHDSAGTATVSIGVVMERGDHPLPREGRVGGDAASAWLVRREYYKPFARMMRMAGIPWVRERLAWGGVEKEQGKFDWAQYQTVADEFTAQGVRVYQIFHDSPGWTHPANGNTRCPDDLRAAYRFARTSASHFAGQLQAWEVWNEPDIGFWPDLSDRYVGLLKAVYLGLRDGNSKALVLQGSLCAGVTPFARNIYEMEIGDYFDVFNWHIYAPPSAYPGALTAYLNVLRPHGLADRPVWLTEAGIRLMGTEGEGKRLLNAGDQRQQCRFVPQSVVMSLMAGTDKHFFFVLPDYLENGVQFGSLRPDLTPYPAFVALSAAANLLGEAEYLGQFRARDEKITAHLFTTPKGNALVAWSDQEAEFAVPTERRSVRVANVFGDGSEVSAENGEVRAKVGPEAVYLVNVGNALKAKLTGTPRPRGKLPVNRPSRIVLVGHCPLPMNKEQDCYRIGGKAGSPDKVTIPYTVEVYNFHEKSRSSGTVEVKTPAGWQAEQPKREVSVDPMGRQVLLFSVVPAASGPGAYEVSVCGQFGGKPVAPSVSHVQFDLAALTPVERKPLAWTDAARWSPSASSNGKVVVANSGAGGLRFEVRFSGEGDRWAYPALRFDQPVDLSGFDGIAFDLKTDVDDGESYVRLMLVEPNGAHYITGISCYGDERRVVFLFRDMTHMAFMGPDPDGRLDLDRIAAVKLGCNTKRDALNFEVRNVELVKFREAAKP